MTAPSPPALTGPTEVPPSEFALYLTTTKKKPTFLGWLLGIGCVVSRGSNRSVATTRARLFRTKGGQLIWATDRVSGPLEPGEEPSSEQIEHADAAVWNTADRAWRFRPRQSRELLRATTLAWEQAALVDTAIGTELSR